ncbi:MAG: hypothetical protein IMZ62_17315 [Chloroflexi bacterium]|nr:hypothetical protein [Chloroflexota bacterium]
MTQTPEELEKALAEALQARALAWREWSAAQKVTEGAWDKVLDADVKVMAILQGDSK